jgi:hypothetical protein
MGVGIPGALIGTWLHLIGYARLSLRETRETMAIGIPRCVLSRLTNHGNGLGLAHQPRPALDLVRLGIRLWEGDGALLLLLLSLLSVSPVLCAIASPLQVPSRFSVTTRVSLSLSLSDYFSEFCSHGMHFSSSSSSSHFFFFFFSEPIAASVAFPWTTEWSGE